MSSSLDIGYEKESFDSSWQELKSVFGTCLLKLSNANCWDENVKETVSRLVPISAEHITIQTEEIMSLVKALDVTARGSNCEIKEMAHVLKECIFVVNAYIQRIDGYMKNGFVERDSSRNEEERQMLIKDLQICLESAQRNIFVVCGTKNVNNSNTNDNKNVIHAKGKVDDKLENEKKMMFNQLIIRESQRKSQKYFNEIEKQRKDSERLQKKNRSEMEELKQQFERQSINKRQDYLTDATLSNETDFSEPNIETPQGPETLTKPIEVSHQKDMDDTTTEEQQKHVQVEAPKTIKDNKTYKSYLFCQSKFDEVKSMEETVERGANDQQIKNNITIETKSKAKEKDGEEVKMQRSSFKSGSGFCFSTKIAKQATEVKTEEKLIETSNKDNDKKIKVDLKNLNSVRKRSQQVHLPDSQQSLKVNTPKANVKKVTKGKVIIPKVENEPVNIGVAQREVVRTNKGFEIKETNHKEFTNKHDRQISEEPKRSFFCNSERSFSLKGILPNLNYLTTLVSRKKEEKTDMVAGPDKGEPVILNQNIDENTEVSENKSGKGRKSVPNLETRRQKSFKKTKDFNKPKSLKEDLSKLTLISPKKGSDESSKGRKNKADVNCTDHIDIRKSISPYQSNQDSKTDETEEKRLRILQRSRVDSQYSGVFQSKESMKSEKKKFDSEKDEGGTSLQDGNDDAGKGCLKFLRKIDLEAVTARSEANEESDDEVKRVNRKDKMQCYSAKSADKVSTSTGKNSMQRMPQAEYCGRLTLKELKSRKSLTSEDNSINKSLSVEGERFNVVQPVNASSKEDMKNEPLKSIRSFSGRLERSGSKKRLDDDLSRRNVEKIKIKKEDTGKEKKKIFSYGKSSLTDEISVDELNVIGSQKEKIGKLRKSESRRNSKEEKTSLESGQDALRSLDRAGGKKRRKVDRRTSKSNIKVNDSGIRDANRKTSKKIKNTLSKVSTIESQKENNIEVKKREKFKCFKGVSSLISATKWTSEIDWWAHIDTSKKIKIHKKNKGQCFGNIEIKAKDLSKIDVGTQYSVRTTEPSKDKRTSMAVKKSVIEKTVEKNNDEKIIRESYLKETKDKTPKSTEYWSYVSDASEEDVVGETKFSITSNFFSKMTKEPKFQNFKIFDEKNKLDEKQLKEDSRLAEEARLKEEYNSRNIRNQLTSQIEKREQLEEQKRLNEKRLRDLEEERKRFKANCEEKCRQRERLRLMEKNKRYQQVMQIDNIRLVKGQTINVNSRYQDASDESDVTSEDETCSLRKKIDLAKVDLQCPSNNLSSRTFPSDSSSDEDSGIRVKDEGEYCSVGDNLLTNVEDIHIMRDMASEMKEHRNKDWKEQRVKRKNHLIQLEKERRFLKEKTIEHTGKMERLRWMKKSLQEQEDEYECNKCTYSDSSYCEDASQRSSMVDHIKPLNNNLQEYRVKPLHDLHNFINQNNSNRNNNELIIEKRSKCYNIYNRKKCRLNKIQSLGSNQQVVLPASQDLKEEPSVSKGTDDKGVTALQRGSLEVETKNDITLPKSAGREDYNIKDPSIDTDVGDDSKTPAKSNKDYVEISNEYDVDDIGVAGNTLQSLEVKEVLHDRSLHDKKNKESHKKIATKPKYDYFNDGDDFSQADSIELVSTPEQDPISDSEKELNDLPSACDDDFPIHEEDPDNPKYWPTYVYHIREKCTSSISIACVIKAKHGSIVNQKNLECETVTAHKALPAMDPYEDAASITFELKPSKDQFEFNLSTPWKIAIPYTLPRHSPKELAILTLNADNTSWLELPTSGANIEELKDRKLTFVEAKLDYPFGTFIVQTKTKVDTGIINKEGAMITSSVDGRVFVSVPPEAIRINLNTTLKINILDSGFWKHMKSKHDKSVLDQVICSSHLIHFTSKKKKLMKPGNINCFLPLNPEIKKQNELSAKPVVPLKVAISEDNDDEESSKMSRREFVRIEYNAFQKSLIMNGLTGGNANECIKVVCNSLEEDKWLPIVNPQIYLDKTKELISVELPFIQTLRCFVVRARKSISVENLSKCMKLMEHEFCVRNSFIILFKSVKKPRHFVLSICPYFRSDEIINELKEAGYNIDPQNSPISVELKERQVLRTQFTGNIVTEKASRNGMKCNFQSMFKNNYKFLVKEIDSYAQRAIDHYRGYLQVFSKQLVKQPVDSGDTKTRKGNMQYHMVEADVMVCQLLISIPKRKVKPFKPFRNSIFNRNLLENYITLFGAIAEGLGSSWKELGAVLHITESRLQSITHHCKENAHERMMIQMLIFWIKGLEMMENKTDLLLRALHEISRDDVVFELKRIIADNDESYSDSIFI